MAKKKDEKVENQSAAKESKDTAKKDKATKASDSDEKALKQVVTDLKKKLAETEDRYLRAEAEMKNIQRHAKEEQADLLKYDGQKLATNVLPVMDNLQRASAVKVEDEAGKQLKYGVEMVIKHLQKALSDANVKKIEAQGTKFDPSNCQAVQTVDADKDHPADTVVKVLQNGYTLSGRVLRPAMVVVAK